MDLNFSPNPRSLVSSASLSPSSSSSSHFHLPSSIRREFLGCGSQLSQPGHIQSRRRCWRPALHLQPPRCAFEPPLSEHSALVVAAAVAAITALQVMYLNCIRRPRGAIKCSDHGVSNAMVGVEPYKQNTEITKQEAVQSTSLGGESFYAEPFSYERSDVFESTGYICSEKVHASDIKDASMLKLQKSVLVHEDKTLPPGYKLPAIGTNSLLTKTPGTEALNSSSDIVQAVNAIMKDNFVVEMPDLLSEDCDVAIELSYVPEMLIEPTFGCFSIPARKKEREINQDNNLEHITTEGGELLVSGYHRLVTQSEEISAYKEEKQPNVRSISRFKSSSTKPLHLTLRDKIGSQIRRHVLKVADISATGSYLTTEYLEQRGPIACFKEGSGSKEKEIVRVHYPTNIGRSLMHKDINGNFYRSPPPNGKVVKDDYGPSGLRTYNRWLRDGRLRDCVELLESMERKGLLDIDKVHHTRFLKACKSQKAVKEAFRFCKLIRKPTLSTFNMLLSICASSQDFDGAFQVMLLVKEAGLRPDCKLYTTLISTCAKCGKVDNMFEVFHEMVNAGVETNVNTYGALIDGCGRAGQVAKAFGAYGIMRSKNLQPDRVIFNSLITACGQSGAVDRAFDVLAEMSAEPQPIEPDHVTVGALMKTCTQGGQVDRVRDVYKMLHQYNIKGTPDVYTIAVRSCSQTGDLDFALSIYEDMKRNSVVPDEMFLSTLLDVAGHAGKVDAAFDILEDARNKGIQLGSVSYSSLMGACCNGKNWQKALELYEDLKAIKLLPTVSMLNAMVTSLCDGDQLLKSVEVLEEMREAGVHPNDITYSILIVACEKKGEAELGFTLLSQAKRDGILPNLIICRCLTGLCLQSFEKAYSLGEQVVSFNSGRPQIENKWTSCAILVYRQTIAAGVIPTIEVFSQVLGCLQFPRDSSLRIRFVEDLGVNFDASKCSNICSLLDGFGEYDTRCFSILEEAASLGVVPRVSIKDNPIVVDARKLNVHTVEVYMLTILKSLKHRLAAGARLPNITIILPIERKVIESAKGERTINLAGRVGQAVGSLLKRLRLPYQGDESFGKMRINGLSLRRWFKPKLTSSSSFVRGPVEMIPIQTRLAKGISDQQRSIRSNNLSLEEQGGCDPCQ